jgi:hypothetical protein
MQKTKKERINQKKFIPTNDKMIRVALREVLDKKLKDYRKNGHKAEVFEELGVEHGTTRIDYAIVNGIMCGYEIKSDKDTLERLPEQVKDFSTVFDEITLVVGRRYLYEALHLIPEWWGVVLAKADSKGDVALQTIRSAEQNPIQKGISIARLLWREEALHILEERNKADGLRNKPREIIYQHLANMFASDFKTLKIKVSSLLISRQGWRSDKQLVIGGD